MTPSPRRPRLEVGDDGWPPPINGCRRRRAKRVALGRELCSAAACGATATWRKSGGSMGGLQATGRAGLKDGAREQRGRVEGGKGRKV
jgi:hypothetical protein